MSCVNTPRAHVRRLLKHFRYDATNFTPSSSPYRPRCCNQQQRHHDQTSMCSLLTMWLWLTFVLLRRSVAHDGHKPFNVRSRQWFHHQVSKVHVRRHFLRACIHKFCMSTCFALPSPPRLTKHIVAKASRCRFSPHAILKSSATLWIPAVSWSIP